MIMDQQKVVTVAHRVRALAIAFVGCGFLSYGTSYFNERLVYEVPRILVPVYDLLGKVGLAVDDARTLFRNVEITVTGKLPGRLLSQKIPPTRDIMR